MRDLIRHIPTGTVLDLRRQDYGHPDGAGQALIASLHGHCHRKPPDLVCDMHRKPLYLKMIRGRMWAAHFDGGQPHRMPPPGMSDEHKRQTDYIARAAESAGFQVAREVRLDTNVRPDAVIYGSAMSLGVEVQRSPLGAVAATRRTRKAMAGGLDSSMWFSDRDVRDKASRPPWFFRVPSIGMNQMPWNTLPPRRAATVTTGLRDIYAARCEYAEFPQCPVTRRRPCGKFHLKHRPWLGVTVDDVATLAPAGEIVPVRYPGRGHDVFLVPPKSLAVCEELTGRRPELFFTEHAERARGAGRDPGRVPCRSQSGWVVRPEDCTQLVLPEDIDDWVQSETRCRGCRRQLLLVIPGRSLCGRCDPKQVYR